MPNFARVAGKSCDAGELQQAIRRSMSATRMPGKIITILVLSILLVSFSGCIETEPIATPTPSPTLTPTVTPTPTPSPAVSVTIYQVIYDPPGPEPDDEMIKLKNTGTTTVDISGWRLTDGEGTYIIPNGTTITSGGYWTVYGLTYNPTRYTRGLYLANTHDSVTVLDQNGNVIDQYSW